MAGSAIATRRLEILAAARTAREEQLRFDPARLRFSLGTSLGDVRIPVQVTPDVVQLVGAAAAELAMLLATQGRHYVPVDDLDRVFLAEGYASLPSPAPTLGPSGGGTDLRTAAQIGPQVHPALTGGVVCAWMGPGGRGRSLTAIWIELLKQAFREMDATRRREETPLIVTLALFGVLQDAEARLGPVLPAPPIDRYLRAATFAGLWIAARTGLARAWRTAGRPVPDPLLWRIEAVLSPGVLLGGRSAALGGATAYGCDLAVPVPRADDLVNRLALGTDPDAVAADLSRALAADDELARRAEVAVAVAHLRRMLHSGIAAGEAQGHGQVLAWLRALFTAPGALASACADEAARRDLLARLAGGGRLGGEAASSLEWVAHALGLWDRRNPAACVGLSREAALLEYATAATALAADGALERVFAPVRRTLTTRTGAESEGGLDTEWEEGRLYRASARAGPILKASADRPLGHLFADVKDFTRRTGLLGRAAMAEFLRTEFYRPILTAAKTRVLGMPHLADRGGVAVNNLLGDAISFSGDIEALVSLAAEIRTLLAAYEARLAREVSSEAVARQLAGLEARFQAELGRLGRRLAEARAAGAPADQVQRLEREQARVTEERAQTLARARGEGLSAGVFISFGPAPVTVLIDDDVFGQNRVAIAEKINESARGTARVASARGRADAALAAARVATGNGALEHAWSVFVEPPLAIEVPPDLERAAVAAARLGDLPTALRYLVHPVRDALDRAARAGNETAGDIYNAGAALSDEALTSFLDAVGESRQLRRLELEPAELPPELRARWFYGTARLELVVTFQQDGAPAELFRRAGTAWFKGLGGVGVWELCPHTGGPGALLRHYQDAWLKAGQRG